MGVDHRRAHIPVAQQLLNGADVVPVLQQVRRKGVPEGVTRRLLRQGGLEHGLADGTLDDRLVQMMAPALTRGPVDVEPRRREHPVPCPGHGHLAGSAREYLCAHSTCNGLRPSEEVVVDIRWGVAPLERQYRDDVAPRLAGDVKGGFMLEPEYQFFVGVDWGSATHVVCVLDRERRRIAERSVPHTGLALNDLADELMTLAPSEPGRIAVAIEVPRGAVVETLLEHGIHVFALNPKQLDRFRDRHTVAGAKDDRRDARVLADSLRTDQPAFRPVRPEAPPIVELRELSRLADELQQETRRLANRLRDQLLRFYPQLLRLCPAADEPWLWTLLSEAPTPEQGQRLSARAVERLLRAHRIRRLTPAAVRTALQSPPLPVQPGTVAAAATHIALLLPRLRLVHEQRGRIEQRIAAVLAAVGREEEAEGPRPEPRDVEILRSLPGIGSLVAATLLGEAAQPLAARDYDTVRALAGAAPVTRKR